MIMIGQKLWKGYHCFSLIMFSPLGLLSRELLLFEFGIVTWIWPPAFFWIIELHLQLMFGQYEDHCCVV